MCSTLALDIICCDELTGRQLFGFDPSSYYRDVLVLFAFIAGFGVLLIGVVWFKLKEKR